MHLQLLALPRNHQRPRKVELKFDIWFCNSINIKFQGNVGNNVLTKKNKKILKNLMKLLVHVSDPEIMYP